MVAVKNTYRNVVSGQQAPAPQTFNRRQARSNAPGQQLQPQQRYAQQVQGGAPVRRPALAPLAPMGQPQGAALGGYGYFPQQAPGQGMPHQQAYSQEPRMLQQARQQGQGLEVQPIQRFASYQDEALYQPNGEYNPLSYSGNAWKDSLRQASAIPDGRERVFDRRGELNAWDKGDALTQIANLLKTTTRSPVGRRARMQRAGSHAEQEQRRQVLAAAAQDPEGFAIMGQELLLPIKDLVDYEGWARKVYRVRPLQQGELFRIAKDVRSTAWVIGQDGQGIEARLFGRYVTPSEFKIGSFPTVDIEEIYQMNYDVLDRAQDTARQEIELEEDKRGRALLDTAAQTVNSVTTYATLGVAAFEDVRFQVERHRLVVEKFLINRAELSDIVKTMSAQVDPVTERELILAGYIGSFLNAVILTSAGTGVEEVVPAGTFYATTGPEYMGEMGIRVELFSEPFNMFSQMRFVKGWAFGEIIGFIIANPRSVAKGQK